MNLSYTADVCFVIFMVPCADLRPIAMIQNAASMLARSEAAALAGGRAAERGPHSG
jgi:hypothetical protein